MDFSIEDRQYRCDPLGAMQQFHITRRLAPVLTQLGLSKAKLQEMGANKTPDEVFGALMGPIADIMAKMSNEDTEYIIYTCLGVVRKKQGEVWAPVTNGRQLMFQDMKMNEMVRITITVIRENLADFFQQAQGEQG